MGCRSLKTICDTDTNISRNLTVILIIMMIFSGLSILDHRGSSLSRETRPLPRGDLRNLEAKPKTQEHLRENISLKGCMWSERMLRYYVPK